ncbi:hypothetical protein CYMTET_19839 [Cymbomonas tetramitiformis]|uniref:Uncharacterized protein n=1 Tax=Cymbomonas tetramitiformis TaxID=36881 RepID=A0AAE0L4S5_9CHLO|nr:hypothetical protein CYMTET_19839 [Cymbomonas tetramitiformis]
MYEALDPTFYQAVRVRYTLPSDLRAVSLRAFGALIARVYIFWAQHQGLQHADPVAGGETATAPSLGGGDLSNIHALRKPWQRSSSGWRLARRTRAVWAVPRRSGAARGWTGTGWGPRWSQRAVAYGRDEQRAAHKCARALL